MTSDDRQRRHPWQDDEATVPLPPGPASAQRPVTPDEASAVALETHLTVHPQAAIPGDAAGSGVSGAIWGDFAIERKIGSGGMGSVYRARQISLDRIVALKVLPAAMGITERYRERFAAEAKAAARIQSPHVVTVYTYGEHAGRLWFAMEFIDGQDLAIRLRGGWRPDWRESLRLAAQVARGLAAAHAFGLVHRDIKPSNLMMLRDGSLKIADFGLVHSVREDAAATGSVVGTAAYMAPEQARGESCDHRTDLYALGCVLYELLCHRHLFAGSSLASLIDQHLHAQPEPLRMHAPWLPAEVEALVLQLLAKEPQRRPDDAARLASELGRLAALPAGRRQVPPAVVVAMAAGAALCAACGWWWLRATPAASASSPVPSWEATVDDAATVPAPAPADAPRPAAAGVEAAPAPAPAATPAPPAGAQRAPSAVFTAAGMPRRAQPDIPAMERAAAALIATGEHLGPAEELAARLGHPQHVDRAGRSILWVYGRYTFVIQDELVLHVRSKAP